MKHSLLAFAALAALACDDPAAMALAESVLEHGVAKAHIECAGQFNGTGSGTYRATKMQDGSCLASGAYSTAYAYGVPFTRAATQFSPRGEAGAADCSVEIPDSFVMSAEDGDWSYVGTPKAIDTFCTGFNLEAFGVAP